MKLLKEITNPDYDITIKIYEYAENDYRVVVGNNNLESVHTTQESAIAYAETIQLLKG